jgi:hypothetical protein
MLNEDKRRAIEIIVEEKAESAIEDKDDLPRLRYADRADSSPPTLLLTVPPMRPGRKYDAAYDDTGNL